MQPMKRDRILSSLRGAERRSNPSLFMLPAMDCFAELVIRRAHSRDPLARNDGFLTAKPLRRDDESSPLIPRRRETGIHKALVFRQCRDGLPVLIVELQFQRVEIGP